MDHYSPNVSGSLLEGFLQEAQRKSPSFEQPAPEPEVPHNPFAGFDPHAGINWLYPIDFTSSEYLPLIAEKCLYHNSLVILPNKNEKCFITAVTMYNIYRWYPVGKIIYVAPKRSMFEDQKAACERFMKFLPTDVIDMHSVKVHERARYWMGKRVFFISSTMMISDINRSAQDMPVMDKVKLIVIDEPQLDHRAHAKIVEKLQEFTKNFRVLCVSTTSSKTVEANLLKSWMISNIELQWGNPHETPEDWLMNKKEISHISMPSGPSLGALLMELKEIAQPYMQMLLGAKLIAKGEFERTLVEQIQQERNRYEQTILTGVLRKDHHRVMLNFHMVEKLLQGFHILQRDGIVAVLEYFFRGNDILVQADHTLSKYLLKLQRGTYTTPHPKFQTLENFLKEFYQRRPDANVLIVVERVDSGAVILRDLGKTLKSKYKMINDRNYSQDVEQFRSGALNTLIVTVQVEPVLEIDNIDLIVLFNMTSQPREFLAHIARTRGSNPGAIVIFTTEGAEQQEIDTMLKTRRLFYYENRNILPIGVDLSEMMMHVSPGLIPPGFQPKGRQIFFNLPTTLQNITVEAEPGTSGLRQKMGTSESLQVGEKRKIVEVLADVPATYDAVNGQTYYEVVPLKQQNLDIPLSPGPAFT